MFWIWICNWVLRLASTMNCLLWGIRIAYVCTLRITYWSRWEMLGHDWVWNFPTKQLLPSYKVRSVDETVLLRWAFIGYKKAFMFYGLIYIRTEMANKTFLSLRVQHHSNVRWTKSPTNKLFCIISGWMVYISKAITVLKSENDKGC